MSTYWRMQRTASALVIAGLLSGPVAMHESRTSPRWNPLYSAQERAAVKAHDTLREQRERLEKIADALPASARSQLEADLQAALDSNEKRLEALAPAVNAAYNSPAAILPMAVPLILVLGGSVLDYAARKRRNAYEERQV